MVNGSGSASALAIWSVTNLLAYVINGVGILTNDGAGGFGFTTNLAQDITITNVTSTTITSSTNIFNVAKGGHLTVSTNITVMTNATLTLSNLPAPSVLVLGTNLNVINATLAGLSLGNDNTLMPTNLPASTISSGTFDT